MLRFIENRFHIYKSQQPNISILNKNILFSFLFIFVINNSWAQALVKGVVKDQNGISISDVSVSYNEKGSTTDTNGTYEITIPNNKEVVLTFKHIGYTSVKRILRLNKGGYRNLNIVLIENVESLKEVNIISHRKEAEGITAVKIETAKNLPSVNAGIESTIKVIGLGASSDNELSTQYKVRGGNYDENLVYVNGIEIYRPFLVRSGQQEGLSFVNIDMTRNVKFSSGGFQAKYGDKLSSVLDISYRKPTGFGLIAEASLVGGSVTVEGVNSNKNTTGILGVRYRDNSIFVNSADTDVNFNPRFIDVQSFITHQFNNKFSLNFLGNFSTNDYRYQPTLRRTKFGTLQNPLELIIQYDGQENDQYLTTFGALSANYKLNDNLKLNFISSVFNTQEEEYFDIHAWYNVGVPNPDASSDDYGESEGLELGNQIDHARNTLDALIGNIEAKVSYKKEKNNFEFGVKYQIENIKDRLIEWQYIDSAGFSVRPPGHEPYNQPYEAFEGPITPYQSIRGNNTTDLQRIMGFAQWNRKTYINDHQLWLSLGIRGQQWAIENQSQFIVSPRFQIAIKPAWEKDMLFRLSGGSYAQPPFYKELRDANGIVQSNVKAQKSYHIVLGGDYSFNMWNRPFKLVTEAYFKYITDVNPYTLDNVRIRYAANNNAIAYAQGFDLRLNGEFVPGTESWFNFSYLKTEENIDDRGYISRPSDQRLKFSILFQDYVPSMPHLKMYMNLVYNTGVPGGSPTYADPYDFQARLGDYKRADIGIFYVFKDAQKKSTKKWLRPFKEVSIGGEIFNMFDIRNAITNTWVRNTYSKRMFAVQNTMTGRVFNLKIKMKM
ncbi:MAG TPA: TonB-dependent receptor [Lutibacter sp.]|nr:TonB-dependent receptor [Lutibacter sp.]